jgi:hypothetical protein
LLEHWVFQYHARLLDAKVDIVSCDEISDTSKVESLADVAKDNMPLEGLVHNLLGIAGLDHI